MTNNPKSEQPSPESGQKRDDLTSIKGIGEALEEWFRESFNVCTFAELAALTAEEIGSRAKDAGRILPLSKIEQVLAQAKQLAKEAKQPAPDSGKPVREKADKTFVPPREKSEWEQLASFVVEFEQRASNGDDQRTTVHRMETAEQHSWPGIETEESCQWMLERIGGKEEMAIQEEPRTAEEVPPPVGEPTALSSIALSITAIRVIQPPESRQRQDLYVKGRALSGFVKGGEPLVFAVTFQLTGLGASEVANKHGKFSVFFNAEDLSTFVVSALGISVADVLREGQSTYTAWLSPLTLLPGLYRLRIVTTVRDVRPVSAYADVPLLQVV